MKTHLLVIDPQNDFCADGKNYNINGKAGALYVPGAHEDMLRLASFLDKANTNIDKIYVTLDQHYNLHIAHPIAWINENGEHPKPFTIISNEDVKIGKWILSDKISKAMNRDDWGEYYTKTLENNSKYALCIWPPHCIIHSTGAMIHPILNKSIISWEINSGRFVNILLKGSNCGTEHYSAIKADVKVSNDKSTWFNKELITSLQDPEIKDILIAGEALSHCVANTVEDIANNIKEEYVKKLVLLKDCTSSVFTFEAQGDDFINKMKLRGMRVTTTKDYLA